jgi:LmbE family N-acetylglucosaminyl deacetylase
MLKCYLIYFCGGIVMIKRLGRNAILRISLSLIILASVGIIYFYFEGEADVDKKNNRTDNKRILVVSPHEDDETLACAGIIKGGIENGKDVRLLLVTNGDYKGSAEVRIKETIAAMTRLGLKKDKIYYLGYGDWGVINELYYNKKNPLKIKCSTTGNLQTYGIPNIIDDYRYLLSGTHSTSCRESVLSDITSVIDTFKPTDIYMPSAFEMHPDHKATGLFVTEAILNIKKKTDYSPMVHEYLIYKAGLPQFKSDLKTLPALYSNDDANIDFTSPYSWENRESVIVPKEMYETQSDAKKINLLNTGAQIAVDGVSGSNADLMKAFDGNESTDYTLTGTNNNMVITVSLAKPIVLEEIRTLINETNTDITVEAADNTEDLDNKTKSYRLLANNSDCAKADWKEIKTSDAYADTIWRITLHQKTPDINVSVSEIEFLSANLKAAAIREHASQDSGGYERYAKKDEIFWKRDMSSLSYNATVSASSENLDKKQFCSNVIDGVILGDGIFKDRNDEFKKDTTRSKDDRQNVGNREFEWAANGQTNGAWIQLSWAKSISANRIILYDRPDLDENILKATLTFSDGSTLNVGPLNKNGSAYIIDFHKKKFDWVKLTVDQAEGTNTGLAEFEVYNN